VTVAGRRVNLSDLADEPVFPEARVPSVAKSAARSARLEEIATNPLNTRDVFADPSKIESIAESMRVHGQIQPCAVVTRSAFLAIFAEHEETLGDATYVQVTGARRRAAAEKAGMRSLDIVVKDEWAKSRSGFIAATAAENIDREDYDPIEEARAVQLLVRECGTGKAAAAQLARTPGWVTQRLNLLKLTPEMQRLVRGGEIPIREARNIATLPTGEQMPAWHARQVETRPVAAAAADGEDGEGRSAGGDTEGKDARPPAVPAQRSSPVAAAIRRLGGTPANIAEALRAHLTPTDLDELIGVLTKQR
jgi:ParB family chromosome partitioning protein